MSITSQVTDFADLVRDLSVLGALMVFLYTMLMVGLVLVVRTKGVGDDIKKHCLWMMFFSTILTGIIIWIRTP